MKYINQIINNKELQIGRMYVYVSSNKDPMVVIHEKAKFQNEEHERTYLESQGAIYILRDLETNRTFDLHSVDYIEERYRIYPIDEENLGFILKELGIRQSRKTQNIIIKHFRNFYNII